MANIGVGQNFDELFLKAEKDPPTFYHINIPPGKYFIQGYPQR